MGLMHLEGVMDMNLWGSAVHKIMALEDAYILILGTNEYVTLRGKMDFGDVMLGEVFWVH